MYDFIIFDLDGTLTDSMPGIERSINHSLKYHGYAEQSVSDFNKYLNLPIDQMFSKITRESNKDQIAGLVSIFRERYAAVGYSENRVYPGIKNAVQNLYQEGKNLVICTSKRINFAEKILELFALRKYFKFISGGDIGIYKWQQLEELLQIKKITSDSIMIGDRDVDIEAANKNGIDSGGVLWGYGDMAELLTYNPKYIFKSPVELLKLI